jgi:MFS family permease
MLAAGLKSALRLKGQSSIILVGLGHCGVHWVFAVFYILQPYIKRDLGISYTELGLLHSIFHFSSFAANLGSGFLADYTGRRVLLQAIAVAMGASALAVFGVADVYLLLGAMMMLIGVANNLWHPAAISFLSAQFPENRGYALSVHSFGASLGDTLAPLVAGWLMLALSWQGAAAVSAVPVFVIAAVLLIVLMPRDVVRRQDAAGDGLTIRRYFKGLAALVSNRAILGLSMMAGFRTMALFGLFMFLPLYMADVLGLEAVYLGIAMAVMQIGGFVAGPVAGIWSDHIGRRPIVTGGLLVTTLMILALTFVSSGVIYVACVAVLGFGLYAIRPVVHSWMMDLTPPEFSGSAASLMFGVQGLMTTLLPLIGGFIADRYGLAAVFYLIAGLMLCANAMAVLLPAAERREPAAGD